eukprot:15405109-Alexandrium_andersonii.AAC.1
MAVDGKENLGLVAEAAFWEASARNFDHGTRQPPPRQPPPPPPGGPARSPPRPTRAPRFDHLPPAPPWGIKLPPSG